MTSKTGAALSYGVTGDKLPPMPSKKNKTRSKAKKMSRRTGKPKASKKPVKPKKSAKKKSAQKNTAKRKSRTRKQRPSVSAEAELKREFRSRHQRPARGGQSQRAEDFEGLSRTEQADSESVDELVEEGNIFEAGAVAGVQEAADSDEREVRTHELTEDDVPEEYQDKD